MDNAALLQKLQAKFPDAKEAASPDPKWVKGGDELQVVVPSAQVADVAAFAKNTLSFDLLSFLTAIDWVKASKFELIYLFMRSADPKTKFFLRAELPREAEPKAPTLSLLYAGADWQEREVYDMFGISFTGHKDLRRILLWEGYPGWPLRKDYVHTPDRYDNGSEIGLPKAAPPPPARPPSAAEVAGLAGPGAGGGATPS